MKMIEDPKLLARSQRIAAERRVKAIEKRRQATLRNTTPGVATPSTLFAHIQSTKARKAGL